MLFALPDQDTLYHALVARDARFDGHVWVAVKSTGIFCKLTCPARKPLPQNCEFHQSVAACLSAGFRPCKRCNPLGQPDPETARLLQALDDDPGRRWSESSVKDMGLDPSTIRRQFKRQFGMTFLDMARQRRLALGFTEMVSGAKVIDAQVAAGFDSPSAFRDAFARRIGMAPAVFQRAARIKVDWLETPLGPMIAAADNRHLHLLEFLDRKALPNEMRRLLKLTKGEIGFGKTDVIGRCHDALRAYFAGENARFDIPLALHGTAFTQQVWRHLQTIPAGQSRSYGALASDLGHPNAARAVARANGANQIAILIPCHRVIGADGSLTGYGGGLWRKQRLLALEKQFKDTSS